MRHMSRGKQTITLQHLHTGTSASTNTQHWCSSSGLFVIDADAEPDVYSRSGEGVECTGCPRLL